VSAPTNFQEAKVLCENGLYAKFFHAMLKRGVALAPGAYEILFVSLAHTRADLERNGQRRRRGRQGRGHMSLLRSEDWSVKPSFVPNGPTSPVVLLIDDTTLTQLAGIPPVAWQTPWSELGNLELVKFSSQMAFFRHGQRRSLLLASSRAD